MSSYFYTRAYVYMSSLAIRCATIDRKLQRDKVAIDQLGWWRI